MFSCRIHPRQEKTLFEIHIMALRVNLKIGINLQKVENKYSSVFTIGGHSKNSAML